MKNNNSSTNQHQLCQNLAACKYRAILLKTLKEFMEGRVKRRRLTPFTTAAKEYSVSYDLVHELEMCDNKFGFLPSHKTVYDRVGLTEDDFSPRNIHSAIHKLQKAAQAKQELYDTLIAGKKYDEIIRFAEMLSLFSKLAADPQKIINFNVAYLKFWVERELVLETYYIQEDVDSFTGIVIFPEWTRIILDQVSDSDMSFEFSFQSNFDTDLDIEDSKKLGTFMDDFIENFCTEFIPILETLPKPISLNVQHNESALGFLSKLIDDLHVRLEQQDRVDFRIWERIETHPITKDELDKLYMEEE